MQIVSKGFRKKFVRTSCNRFRPVPATSLICLRARYTEEAGLRTRSHSGNPDFSLEEASRTRFYQLRASDRDVREDR